MDWRAAARWTLIIGGAFAAGMIAIWLFLGVWAGSGLAGAFIALATASLLAYGWSKRQAERERERLKL